MDNQSFKIFDNVFMESGGVQHWTSPSMPMIGNRATLAILLKNASGSITAGDIVFKIELSYDDVKFFDASNGDISDMTAFGHQPVSVGSIDAAFIRAAASITGVSQKMNFDGWLSFSQQ